MKYRNLTLSQLNQLASKVGRNVTKKGAVIGLIGNLGSGKTTFSKALAKAVGIKSLKSPTFIISQRYSLKNRFLYHLDFYRLHSKNQLLPLGLDEILNKKGSIVLIEWVDKFPFIQKKCNILVHLKVQGDNQRDVTIKYN